MRMVQRARGLILALGAVLSLGVAGLAACGDDGASTGAVKVTGLQRQPPLQVGSLSLPEATTGATGAFAFKADKPGDLLLVYFGYTNCPDLCPTTMSDLRQAFKKIGSDADRISVAMVTVDPDRDSGEILTGYLGSFFSARFHAVRTEDPAALTTVEKAFLASSKVTTTPEGKVEVSHSALTYAVDDAGKVVVEWPFGTTPDAFAKDLSALLKEAS